MARDSQQLRRRTCSCCKFHCYGRFPASISPTPPAPLEHLTNPSPLLGNVRPSHVSQSIGLYCKIFIKAFPRGSDGRRGILESTGLVEVNDCLTAINGVPLDKSSGLREAMASIRAAKSPLSLRFARYPPPPLRPPSSSSSSLLSSSAVPALASAVAGAVGKSSSSDGAGSLAGGGGGDSGTYAGGARARAGTGDAEKRDLADPELDDVLNSALVLGLGERVADIQKRNAQLLQEVDRIGRAAADKRQVRSVCIVGADFQQKRANVPSAFTCFEVFILVESFLA